MSEINWGAIATAFRQGGPEAAVAELDAVGYAIVPKEPTMAMQYELRRSYAMNSHNEAKARYGAMLAVKPKVTA